MKQVQMDKAVRMQKESEEKDLLDQYGDQSKKLSAGSKSTKDHSIEMSTLSKLETSH